MNILKFTAKYKHLRIKQICLARQASTLCGTQCGKGVKQGIASVSSDF